jgi:predicted PurR-regulated permease PerM
MPQERFTSLHWLLAGAVFAWLLTLLAPVLTPFLAAGVMAYLCAPLVEWLCAHKIPRALAVVLIMLLLFGAMLLLVLIVLPMLQRELVGLVMRLPALLDALRLKLLPYLQQYLHLNVEWDGSSIRTLISNNLKAAGGMAGRILPWLSGSTATLLRLIVNLVLFPVALFYLLRDGGAIRAHLERLIPLRLQLSAMRMVAEVDTVLGEFLRGQVIVMLLMSTFYSVGLWLTGLEYAFSIGVVAGLLVFIPYIGVATGLLLATLEAFSQFDLLTEILPVWLVFACGHLLESMLITPHFVGERIGLHPLAVIFSLLAFGQLFGFFGVLLELPMAAVLLVGLRHAREWYLHSAYYKD